MSNRVGKIIRLGLIALYRYIYGIRLYNIYSYLCHNIILQKSIRYLNYVKFNSFKVNVCNYKIPISENILIYFIYTL